jgi:hypothetical protein
MRNISVMVLVLASIGTVAACAERRMDDGSETARGSTGMATTTSPGDALQDCLVRIPKDATPGQRDIAERTCQRDAADRRTTVRGEAASSDTSGDTRQACMARIPNDASAGQRMVAEQSCDRDEANRRPVQAVPGP